MEYNLEMGHWWLIRKPLSEKSIVDNVLKHGTGAINIDKSRIATEEKLNVTGRGIQTYSEASGQKTINSIDAGIYTIPPQGRFPANLIHDGSEAVMQEFAKYNSIDSTGYDDKGSVARFFYCAKTSVGERNMGLSDGEKSNHPTVKPVKLMSYLVNLIAPPITKDYTPVIMDMFMGSGSTGIAALLNGYNFIGMELEEEYFDIANTRIMNYEKYRKFLK